MKIEEENKNKVVITTKYVLENKSVITYVFYDEDGDWQFFGKEDFTESDAKVISIEEILKIDTTLLTLPIMSKGQSAFRKGINADWEISNKE